VQNAGVVAGVNLLGARGGAEKAGDAMEAVLVSPGGKGGVLGMRVRLTSKAVKRF